MDSEQTAVIPNLEHVQLVLQLSKVFREADKEYDKINLDEDVKALKQMMNLPEDESLSSRLSEAFVKYSLAAKKKDIEAAAYRKIRKLMSEE